MGNKKQIEVPTLLTAQTLFTLPVTRRSTNTEKLAALKRALAARDSAGAADGMARDGEEQTAAESSEGGSAAAAALPQKARLVLRLSLLGERFGVCCYYYCDFLDCCE